jgi:hypothetical protein
VFLLYLDEFGHPGPYDPSDTRHRHHPLFGFAGVAIEATSWRDLDRSFLRLKLRYYAEEIRKAQIVAGIRPERWEPKQLRSRRDRRFAADVLGLVRSCRGTLFAYGCVKRASPRAHGAHALYNSQVQGALETYERFLRSIADRQRGQGVAIVDRRSESQNQLVLESAQSHLFANPYMRQADARVIETPLLVATEWYHGVQLADVVGGVVGAAFRARALGDASFAWAEQQFGRRIDSLSFTEAGWSTVFVRR